MDASFRSEEKNCSEHTAEQIDGEVRRIIDKQSCELKLSYAASPGVEFSSGCLLKKETLQRKN